MRFPETNAFFKVLTVSATGTAIDHRAGSKARRLRSSHFGPRPVTTAGRFLPFDGAEDKALRRSTQIIPGPVPGPGALF